MTHPNNRRSLIDHDKVMRLKAQGLDYLEIAERLGVNRTSILGIFKKHAAKSARPEKSPP